VPNVSAYFCGLAQREPDWAAARAIIAEMIAETGEPSEEDYAWAEESLGLRQRTPELV